MIISNLSGGGISKKSTQEIIKNINTDVEPLNFLHYIYDISVFGADSYVMDVSNEGLWRQLLTGSLTMYGHDAIHEYIYNRLTAKDVDYLITHNVRLGQSFNSFYNTGLFPDGGIDAILKGLTIENYNTLELKLQQGINRYIESHVSAPGAGAWLDTVFGLENTALQACDTLANLIAAPEVLTLLIGQESTAMVLVNNVSIYQTDLGDAFHTLLTYIASSTMATTALIESSAAGNSEGGGISEPVPE